MADKNQHSTRPGENLGGHLVVALVVRGRLRTLRPALCMVGSGSGFWSWPLDATGWCPPRLQSWFQRSTVEPATDQQRPMPACTASLKMERKRVRPNLNSKSCNKMSTQLLLQSCTEQMASEVGTEMGTEGPELTGNGISAHSLRTFLAGVTYKMKNNQ